MNNREDCKKFIEKIAKIAISQEVARSSRTGHFLLPSITIAQACLESAYGKSDLATKANNIFGMKAELSGNSWPDTSWKGRKYAKVTGEQKKNGETYKIKADFRAYDSVEDSVYDHSSYILNSKNGSKNRYAGVSKNKNPRLVATAIKNGGYATSLSYVDKVMAVVDKWNLTQYDTVFLQKLEGGKAEVKKKLKINVHAGHCPDGKGASGAVGIIKESTESRKVKDALIKYLEQNGCSTYDCTCDTKETQSDCLAKICNKCNSHTVDLDVSIHFNSGRNDKKGDGKIAGFETWVYSNSGKKKTISESVRKKMKTLGFSDRGTKESKNLYYLKHTVAEAVLLEICFVDDADDVQLYKKVGAESIGEAIGDGILGAIE